MLRERSRSTTLRADGSSVAAGTPQGETNPCSTVGTPNSIAVIERRARQLNPSGDPVACTSDTGCGTGFLCAQRPYPGGSTRYCARYICQATTTADSPDEPSQLSETCGCNTSSLLWTSVPSSGPNQVRRIQRRTSSTGVKTSYQHDDQGRIIAQCVGDDNDIVVRGDASSCPWTGQLEEWTYDSELPSYAGITPWAVREYRRTSVRGSGYAPYSRVWTRNTATGQVTSDVETAWTYSYATWTWAQQTRTTTYSFSGSPHDGWTQRVGPGDGSSSDPVQTAEYWPISSTSTTSGQVRYSRWRRERPGDAALEFQRESSAHSIYGAPGTEVDETGRTSTTTFDAAGRARTITTSLGTTRIAYDSLGRMLSMRNPSGQATVYEYAAGFERPLRIITTDSPTLNGSSEATAATNGAVMEDTVDPYAVHIARRFRARVAGVDQAEWMRTTQHLDDHGRVGSDENAATGLRTTRTYDNYGELLETQDTLGRVTTLIRDYLGGMQASTTFVYQGTSVRAAQTTQPNGHTLYYTYDDWGQLVYSYGQDMGSTWSIYAPQGRKFTQYESNGTRTQWSYDRAGRVTAIDYNADYPSNNGGDRRFWYDALPSGVTCPSGLSCGNLLGRLAYVENDATLPSVYKTFYGYTSAGLLQHEHYAVGGISMRTLYEYDSFGRRTRTTFPFWTGDSVRYTYNDSTISHDGEQVSAAHWDKNGVAHRPVVERIERMPNGPISRMWYAQRASGGLPTNASIERNWRLDGTRGSTRPRTSRTGATRIIRAGKSQGWRTARFRARRSTISTTRWGN
jgi:YD repeat-containing protein